MSSTTTTTRKPLVLAKAVRNTLDWSTIVKAKRSQQRHVLLAASTRTLCGIDTAKWRERDDVSETTVTCPVCAAELKAAAKKAKQPDSRR
jgi:hypothetical protein